MRSSGSRRSSSCWTGGSLVLNDVHTVTVDPAPTEADLAAVEAGLSAYNQRFIGPPDRRPLARVLRDCEGTIRGGLVGDTSRGWLYVDYLWVADDLRGSGWGSRLLADAEREAVARGCHRAYLETNDYQAPDFYLRRGYAVVGRIPDFSGDHDRLYLTKSLAISGDPRPSASPTAESTGSPRS